MGNAKGIYIEACLETKNLFSKGTSRISLR